MKTMIFLVVVMVGFGLRGEITAQEPAVRDTAMLSEQEAVRMAVVSFEGRLISRDVVSLTGVLEEDAVIVQAGRVSEQDRAPQAPDKREIPDSLRARLAANPSSVGEALILERVGPHGLVRLPASEQQTRAGQLTPVRRDTVTTIEDAPEVRRATRTKLEAMFKRLPEHVRIHIVPKDIVVEGLAAVAVADYYFRRSFGDPDDAPAFARQKPQALTLNLRKVDGRWLVADLDGIANRLLADVPR